MHSNALSWKYWLLLILSGLVSVVACGQQSKIHSHNDYLRKAPFWEAYANGCASIEVDVILVSGSLFVAHEQESIQETRTLESLYLQPIHQGLRSGLIANPLSFFLTVDIKSEPYETLEQLMRSVRPYEEMMYSADHGRGLKLVVSGNRPLLQEYADFPEYIFFDHQDVEDLETISLDKVAMVSLPFDRYSQWGGKGRMVAEEIAAVIQTVEKVHQAGKPIRFWASPDSKSAWKALHDIGVDYINSDKPFEVSRYLANLGQRYVGSSIKSELVELDFGNDEVQRQVDNVILMIGDGNGLAQLSAGMYANGNALNITNLKNVGLAKTQSADDFTTDSAAGGTALATGNKTNNRGVGIDSNGRNIESLAHILSKRGFGTGIISSDHITGATPATFYAHQKDRDLIGPITEDLYGSSLNLFIGAGKNDFLRYQNHALDSLEASGFSLMGSLDQVAASTDGKVGYFASNHGLPNIEKGRAGFLKNSTEAAISYLENKGTPFFLLVENGHIDVGGHVNDARMIVEEVIDFDQAVGAALKFASNNPNTLVIITADHETGGVTIPQGNVAHEMVELEFSTEDHTGIMVPVFAFGPHSGDFSGVYENTAVFDKIMTVLLKYHANTKE
ncbi:alkaline phosphatase [Algoriphagus sp. AGSA1]|uniref:alkaline phosphatase n=1 Tax=Algoriphagus sp. AGSA1 TaxID=2907213 RepID=UPI001F29004C|nr:alkaline phosphatase [Algoriphagus sp. AGSA1]MCE7053156.1 alkaline phosphatase [Algoriphagus sp. AGSA1]